MKDFIVVSDGFDKDLFKSLCSTEKFDVHPKSKLTTEELDAVLPKANALVVRSATQVTSSLLNKAPHLKYVIRAGEGTDNIDVGECQKRNVKVANTPGANSNSAAEMSIALMMTVLRKTAFAHQSMTKGEWEKTAFSGNELWRKNLGIVGFGRIGQIVAQRLSGFEPNILFFDPIVKDVNNPNIKKVEKLSEIFSNCDIITLHMPYMPSTHHLIGQELLNLMKPSAILINASRGNIVNEEALLQTLSQNKIKGAGFDVFATEPLSKDSPLRHLPNLVLTPHLGASTDEAQFRVGEMAVHQLKEFFINHNLLNEVRV